MEKESLQHDLLLQEVMRIRENQKRIGTRKLIFMMQHFMQQHFISIGRDAMFDLLAENNLLVRKRNRRKPVTTFSNHWMFKYSNLIIGFIPTAPNQLWVSDITYMHVADGHAYLSLITDAYSRKIVGYYLCENLSADGCIEALQFALKNINRDESIENLIHHSDRGTQYCCIDYVKLLNKNKTQISMTQSGDPLENALAERVNGILKDELLEEVYPTFEQAKHAVATAVSVYNHQRPHSSVEYLTPVQAHQRTGELKRYWKNYYTIKKQKEVAML